MKLLLPLFVLQDATTTVPGTAGVLGAAGSQPGEAGIQEKYLKGGITTFVSQRRKATQSEIKLCAPPVIKPCTCEPPKGLETNHLVPPHCHPVCLMAGKRESLMLLFSIEREYTTPRRLQKF